MDTETLLSRMAVFDPELYGILHDEIQRQRYTLSLIPTANAASPFSAYLGGSILGNAFMDHHSVHGHTKLEEIAAARAEQLFGCDHAIVRLGSIEAASRVVLYALAQPDDTIMSFNLRKKEHCTGSRLQFNFLKYSIEPDTQAINFEHVAQLAKESQPKIIIFSPVNYPHHVDYRRLEGIAHAVGAKLWVDLGQNAGLVAAGQFPSPVPYADVVTFPADSLHGPQNGIILTRADLADKMDQTVIDTGHASLKKNILASLAMTFQEAATEEFKDYCRQVIANAKALEAGLAAAGTPTLCHGTENHLVLARLDAQVNGEDLKRRLTEVGILVKPDIVLTADDTKSCPILRLSSLDPTTRSLKENDMDKVGRILGSFLQSDQSPATIKAANKQMEKIIADMPLFSEEWLPVSETSPDDSRELLNMLTFWNA
jgi:glycine hydroxymethyltransferase